MRLWRKISQFLELHPDQANLSIDINYRIRSHAFGDETFYVKLKTLWNRAASLHQNEFIDACCPNHFNFNSIGVGHTFVASVKFPAEGIRGNDPAVYD